jgi:hypothetical protein
MTGTKVATQSPEGGDVVQKGAKVRLKMIRTEPPLTHEFWIYDFWSQINLEIGLQLKLLSSQNKGGIGPEKTKKEEFLLLLYFEVLLVSNSNIVHTHRIK